MVVVPADDVQGRGVRRFRDHVLDELNIKALRIETEGREVPADSTDWVVSTDRGLTVALHSAITPDLEREGLARDVVRHIQQLRKQADLDLTDRVEVLYDTPDETLLQALNEHGRTICAETQAVALLCHPGLAGKPVCLASRSLQLEVRKV